MKHPLANKNGIAIIGAVCALTGCPDCGMGRLRRTSKRYHKCLECGRMKIERPTVEEAFDRIEEALREGGMIEEALRGGGS